MSPRVSELARSGSQSRTELEDVTARAFELAYIDQLRLYGTLQEVLAVTLADSSLGEEIERRSRVLDAIGKVVAARNMEPGERLTAKQFTATAKDLGLEVGLHEAVSAFSRWRWAVDASLGEHVPLTSATRALKRATAGRKRTYEHYLTCLRRWLSTCPSSERMEDYDAFARECNSGRRDGYLPLVRAKTIVGQLAICWTTAKRVARGELSYDEARRTESGRRPDEDDFGDLIGLTGIARALDMGCAQAQTIIKRSDFPAPAITIGGRRAWHLDDVEAYRDGRPCSGIAPTQWQQSILVNCEVSRIVGLTEGSIRRYLWLERYDLLPQPSGRVGGAWWWRREIVCEWVKSHPQRVAARDASGHVEKRDLPGGTRNA